MKLKDVYAEIEKNDPEVLEHEQFIVLSEGFTAVSGSGEYMTHDIAWFMKTFLENEPNLSKGISFAEALKKAIDATVRWHIAVNKLGLAPDAIDAENHDEIMEQIDSVLEEEAGRVIGKTMTIEASSLDEALAKVKEIIEEVESKKEVTGYES